MKTRKTAILLLALSLMAACGSGRHASKNVLPPNAKRNTAHKKDNTPKGIFEKTDNNSSGTNTQTPVLIPGTAAYYAYRTDSVQQASAHIAYIQNLDSIISQISRIPSKNNNAAVTSNNFYATPNFSIRKPSFVIIHHTNQSSAAQTLYTFSVKHSQVSAHYVIGKDGEVYQMANDYLKAWHAGKGKWGNIIDMNSCSIGIELDNNGVDEPFPDAQIIALIKLLTLLKNKYDIPTANFIGHADFAVGRKDDPSKYFPWKRLADAGFGYWYDVDKLKEPPTDFNALLALRVIGYDISNPGDAVEAFKLHFIQTDISKTITDYDKKVLYNLYTKF